MRKGPPGEPEANPNPPSSAFVSAVLGTYGTNLTVAALSLINVLIVARALGPEGRGSVAFLLAMATLTATFAMLAIQEANANLAGRELASRPALATNSLLFSLLTGGAAVLILVGLFGLFPALKAESDPVLRWVALSTIPLIIVAPQLAFLVRADYRFKVTNLAALLLPVSNVVVNGLFALLGWLTVTTALASWVAGTILEAAFLAFYVARRLEGFGRPNLALARRAVAFGLRSHPGRLMMAGNYRIDQWFVGAMAGPRELGLYSVAVAWVGALFFLPTALVVVQRPFLVRTAAKHAPLRAALVFRGAILITVPLAVGLFVLAPVLILTLFGSEFRGAIDDLRILVPGAFGIIALKVLGNALTAQGRPGLETAAAGAAFVATLALDILLIPSLGGNGAAIASTLAYTVGGTAAVVIFTRSFRFPLADLRPRAEEVPRLARALRQMARRRGRVAAGERR